MSPATIRSAPSASGETARSASLVLSEAGIRLRTASIAAAIPARRSSSGAIFRWPVTPIRSRNVIPPSGELPPAEVSPRWWSPSTRRRGEPWPVTDGWRDGLACVERGAYSA